jgi:hypothetical protein
MPCMGPDVEGARMNGRGVGEKLLAELVAAHNLWDIKPIEGSWLPTKRQCEQWAKAKEDFVVAVGELFAWDSMNSF